MKRRLTQTYMVVFSVSVFVIIVVWLVLLYIFVFSGEVIDLYKPQYLINRFEDYVDTTNVMTISDEGKEILLKNDLWAQIINEYGDVVYEFNTPKVARKKYDVFQLSDYTLNSDALGSETIFVSRFNKNKQYGVIIGCDSSKITKISVKLTGSLSDNMLVSIILLLMVFIIVGIIAGTLYSKNISAPVNRIIDTINKLKSDSTQEEIISNNKIFKTVFDTLEKLRLRLISADIERKKAETQRNEWISNISHDMKTPLSTIRGYAEIMSDENFSVSSDERRNYSEKIKNNTDTINELIDELKFSRLLQNGEIELQREEINMCNLLKECCDDIPVNLKVNNISFDFESEEIYAVIDKQLLKRCFINIISNAIIHNTSDVNISIVCRNEEKVVVEIIDNGKGISDKDIENVFNRYYRGAASNRTVGSGLGLAIAKDIVEVHGGTISVESELGKGSKFIISI